MATAVLLNNVTKKFGNYTAVDALNLQIEEGEIYGFLGPNGSGKSTTLRMMMGLLRPNHGHISLFSYDIVTHRAQAMRNVGCIIEKPDFYTYLTAKENIQLLARTRLLSMSNKDIDALFHKVGLQNHLHQKVKGFSHGMKQRLGIAQAIMHKPKLIILDEPNTGLDPQGIIDLRQLILQLNKEMGMTVLFSSHILSEVQEICDSMIVIHKGKTIVQGKVSTLISNEKLHVRIECDQMQKAKDMLDHSQWSYALQSQEFAHQNQLMLEMSKSEIPALISTLQAQNIQVYAIDYRNQLEAYFLKITNE